MGRSGDKNMTKNIFTDISTDTEVCCSQLQCLKWKLFKRWAK